MKPPAVLDADAQDLAVVRGYPGIPWLAPLRVLREDGAHGWACRVCVARYGLHAQDVQGLWRTSEEVLAHLAAFHRLNPYG